MPMIRSPEMGSSLQPQGGLRGRPRGADPGEVDHENGPLHRPPGQSTNGGWIAWDGSEGRSYIIRLRQFASALFLNEFIRQIPLLFGYQPYLFRCSAGKFRCSGV
jgi:hypothetical protein